MRFKNVLIFFGSLGFLILLMAFSVKLKAEEVDFEYVEITETSGLGSVTYNLGTKAAPNEYIFDVKYSLNMSPPNISKYKYIVIEGAYKDASVYERDFIASGISQSEYSVFFGTTRRHYNKSNLLSTELNNTTFEYFDLTQNGTYSWGSGYNTFEVSYYVSLVGGRDLSYWTNYWKNTVKVYATNNPLMLVNVRENALMLTYEDGYNDGLNFGYNKGYDEGYDEGYDSGYYYGSYDGYDNGYNDAISLDSDIRPMFNQLLSFIGGIFKLEIFPGVTIGTLISIPIAFGVFRWFLKIIS